MIGSWKKLLPGFIATMMGIGFSRFSFTPVSALMVEKHLLTSSQITIIAAFIMAAYAIGAFSATRLATRFGFVAAIRFCFIVVSVGLLAEGLFATFYPVLFGRICMSIAGAVLMVLGPGAVLSSLPPESRGFAAGFIFTGIGLGIMAAGSIVAIITTSPIFIVAMVLFTIAVAISTLGWKNWPYQAAGQPPTESAANNSVFTYGFYGLLLAYGLDAVAFIPHTVYLSDFVASELGHGAKTGGSFWAVFGLGGIIGAASSATLRKKFGGQLSLELALATKALFIGILGFATSLPVITVSAFIVGALVPGIVMLVSTRTSDLAGSQNITFAWGIMTGAFAIGQFVGATGMSLAYLSLSKYQPLFAVGGLIEALGLLALIISSRFLTPHTKGISS